MASNQIVLILLFLFQVSPDLKCQEKQGFQYGVKTQPFVSVQNPKADKPREVILPHSRGGKRYIPQFPPQTTPKLK